MASWRQVIDKLADRHRVIAYDLRGHGRSGYSPGGDYSLDAHAEDLGAVLERMTGGQPAVLVGHSLGGAVILARTKHRLDGVAAAVFAGSAAAVVTVPGLPARGLPGPARRALLRVWSGVLHLAARAVRRVRDAGSAANAVGRWLVFAPGDSESAVDRARRDFLATDPDVLAQTSFAAVRADRSAPARQLTVPVVVLRGDLDKEADTADVRMLLDRLSDARLITLPGKGHMIPMTDGVLVAEHITRFVAGLTGGSGVLSAPADSEDHPQRHR